jgi:trans-aconitate methyltransferase
MQIAAKDHWENIFASTEGKDFSWFQAYPKTSVAFLELFSLPLHAKIIDIGGGDSNLVDILLEKGYQHISVLDISENALKKSQKRLGEKANKVTWIVSDINDFKPAEKYDFWHDRAAFHFLTSEERIAAYVTLAEQYINPGGYLVLGTFSENGPEKCSGFTIKQYSETSMSVRFDKSFQRIKCVTEDHKTPFNTFQHFLFCSFRRK